MYCMVEQWPVTLEGIYLTTPFHTQSFSPDPPLYSQKRHPCQMSTAPNHPQPRQPRQPRTHRHTERSLFCALKKRLHRIKRSNMFSYNISMKIVTIGDKIVARILEFSNGVLFWNHWKNSGPLPTNGCNRIIKLILVKTRKNVRCPTYKREKNSSDNI